MMRKKTTTKKPYLAKKDERLQTSVTVAFILQFN